MQGSQTPTSFELSSLSPSDDNIEAWRNNRSGVSLQMHIIIIHTTHEEWTHVISASVSVCPGSIGSASSSGASVAKLINSCTFSHLVSHSLSFFFKYSSYFTRSSSRCMRPAGVSPSKQQNHHQDRNEGNFTLTSTARFFRTLNGSTKFLSFFLTGGFTSGIFPSHICSTTDTGEVSNFVALERISARVCPPPLINIIRSPEERRMLPYHRYRDLEC